MEEEHVMRHKRGIWNSLWTDMMIETSYMKVGKGPLGIIGVTTKPRAVKVWAKDNHIQSELLIDLDYLIKRNKNDAIYHKEEGKCRIVADASDIKKLRKFNSMCISF